MIFYIFIGWLPHYHLNIVVVVLQILEVYVVFNTQIIINFFDNIVWARKSKIVIVLVSIVGALVFLNYLFFIFWLKLIQFFKFHAFIFILSVINLVDVKLLYKFQLAHTRIKVHIENFIGLINFHWIFIFNLHIWYNLICCYNILSIDVITFIIISLLI